MGRKKPQSEEAERLEPFADLLGKIPDERIAEMAGVSLEAVAAAVVAEPDGDGRVPESWLAGAPDPIKAAIRAAEANGWTYAELTGTGEEGDPTKGVSIRSGLTMAQMAVTPRPAEPTVDLEPVPEPDEFRPEFDLASTVLMTRDALVPEADPDTDEAPEPPRAVRVLRKARILDAKGHPWKLGTRDVYSGAKALFLWTHYRDLVERHG